MALNIQKLRKLLSPVSYMCRQVRYGGVKSSQASGNVFDKELRIKFLDKSATNQGADVYDYLRDCIAKDVCDRVEDLTSKEERFVLSLSSCSGLVAKYIKPEKVRSFVECDISRECLKKSHKSNSKLPLSFPTQYVNADEEYIPIRPNTQDLVISCLNIHWVNDLAKCFKQVHQILQDNSPFIGCLFGGDTLYELRSTLQLAELERLSGFSSHCAPKTTGQDIASLLQATGFRLVTVDNTDIKIRYPSIFELMFDLQGMGENNSSIHRSTHLNRDVLLASSAIYQQMYGSNNPDEGVPATFQVIHFIGWKNPTKATPLKSA